MKILIPAIDEQVALLEESLEQLDTLVHRSTGLNQEHDSPRLGKAGNKLLGILEALEVGSLLSELLLSARDALVYLLGRPVAHADLEAVLSNVEGKVLRIMVICR